MKNCNCDTDINRDGSGQLQRYLKALDPGYAPIDGRSTEDLLVFAKKYAAQIRFYDIPGSIINDGIPAPKVSWREFFRRDLAVIAASIAVTEAERFKKEYDEVNERLQYHTTPAVYAALYAPIVGMLKKIDRWYSVAIPENPLYADLKLAIESDLKMQVQKIMAYEEGFKFVDASVDLKIELDSIENKEVWGLNETVAPDAGIYQGNTQQEKILSASLFTEDIFHAFYHFLNKLIYDSEKYLQFAMEQYPGHQPHMALFITFLQLFNKVQQQMNGLTGRLLDFYYKDVLHLQTKPSIADKLHIVFELAKDITEYGLPTGTALKAGPDISGVEQTYTTTDDLVINQAKVKELKTIFIKKEATGTVNNIKTIYPRPIANSADGYGLPFETALPKWPTFGKKNPDTSKLKNICQFNEVATELLKLKNEAQVGFAIASPQLVLQGGNRIIAVQMAALRDLMGKKIEIWLSAEDGWLTIDKEIKEKNELIKSLLATGGDLSTGMPAESGYFIDLTFATLYICLPLVEKAIVPFDPELHPDRKYTTPYPVMQVLLNPEIEFNPVIFNQVTISDLSLSVRVGSINLPQLSLDIVLGGKVIDATTGAALAGITISESRATTGKISDINGEFSIPTAGNRILIFKFPSYKTKFIPVTSTNPIIVRMERGESTQMDSSALIIPSFFDGLKQLILENDDGPIVPNKPFDPFTAYPKFGSALYIGSHEVFNKPVNELAINIKHQSDTLDAAADLNWLVFLNESTQNDKLNPGEIYKLSLLEQKEWTALCTSYGGNFMEGYLTHDVLFTKGNDGVGSHLPALNRNPLSYSTGQAFELKGFLQLQYNTPLNTDSDRDVFQLMAALAIALKVKDISVSYFSRLTKLEPEVDQFFHVYPFGLAEIYSQPVNISEPANNRNKLTVLLKSKTSVNTVLKNLPVNFQKLDAAKNYLLVNANQLLLPQFTYLGPYEQYRDTTNQMATVSKRRKLTGDLSIRKAPVRIDGDALAEKLILSASGWTDKLNGGANQYSARFQEEGMLFIGLEKAQPLQMISMLFHFAEGSAEDEDNDPPEIHWSYLTNNEWRPLKEESIVSDGTVGFQTTGIIKIEIPGDATSNNTIITSGLHWLCASVTSDSNRIPMLIDVVTQAVLANFEDNNNSQSHFDIALAAGSISKLAVAVAQVGKVQQPFASFDGKHAEIGKEFYTRVSERLRHKARAITAWDYEHLVLDRFPSIYKVKCITHTDPNCLCIEKEVTVSPDNTVMVKYNTSGAFDESELGKIRVIGTLAKTLRIAITVFNPTGNIALATAAENMLKAILISAGFADANITINIISSGEPNTIEIKLSGRDGKEKACCGPQVAPGHVLLVPISNLKNRNAVNPLQPKTSRRVLLDIEAYLEKRTSPFVRVHAKNPVYEQVLVFFRVKFMDGFDKGFHMKKLNEEIVHYLTPWAFDDITEVKFGQKIYASSIINFIEERNYVNFITDFLMLVCRTGCCDDIVQVPGDVKNGDDILNSISGCGDMEILLQDETEFMGDIVAKPSTARSLLVSAPQHIIIPYLEPDTLSPCQNFKLKKGTSGGLIEKGKIIELIEKRDNPDMETKPVPVMEVDPGKEMEASESAVMHESKTTVENKTGDNPVAKKTSVKRSPKKK